MYSSTITTTKLFLTISTLESTTPTESREQRTENSRGEEKADSAEEQRAVSIEQRAESRGQWSSGKSLKRKREQGATQGEAWDEEEDGKIRKKMRISSNNMAPPHDQVEPMEVD
jgi:hypothetical protein